MTPPRIVAAVVAAGLLPAVFVTAQVGPVYAAPWAGPYLLYTLLFGLTFLRRNPQ